MTQQWQALKEHFYHARELPKDLKEKLLKELGEQNPGLADDLQFLLKQGEQAGDFMEEPAWEWLSNGSITKPEPLSAGTLLGHYRVERLLGQGGMGAVYLASQNEPVKRQVALKLMIGFSDDERFRLEQQTLARLEHPNIVRYYDAGYTQDGDPYLVMEFLAGVPITQWAETHPLELRLQLFRQVCRAITFAHKNNIIHRDIKPENVLVVDGPEGPTVKIIDFGIAKDQSAESCGFTRTGQFLGTPDYISPEQAGLIPEPIGPASDIYALGVLLYQLVCHRLPYHFENKPLFEWHKILTKTEPSPPSAFAEKSSPRDLWRDLDAIVLKAMEKEPALRYGSVEGLLQDIDRAFTGGIVDAVKPDLAYRMRKLRSRHHRKVQWGTIFLLLLCVLGWMGYWSLQTARVTNFWNRYHGLVQNLNQAYLLPLHDIRPQREALRTYIAEINRDIPPFGRAKTAAHHLLGKAHMELDQWSQALKHLSLAASRDPKNPEIAADKGLCQARLATIELAQVENIRDREQRAFETQRFKRLYVDEALKNLARSRNTEPAQQAYLSAYYHFLSKEYMAALEHIDKAIAGDPHHYRAYLLMGRVHEARAASRFAVKDRDGHRRASAEALAAFEKTVEIARGYPTGYKALSKHLLSFKKRMRGDAGVDESDLLHQAAFYMGEGLRAQPNNGSFMAIMAAIEMEGAIDRYEKGIRERSEFDHVNDLIEIALNMNPCEPTALLCRGQTSYYLAGIEYPKMRAVTELALGIEALETLLALHPSKPVHYKALSQLYATMPIVCTPVGLNPGTWHQKSLDLNHRLTRYIPKTSEYYLSHGTAYRNYALYLDNVGADPSEALVSGLEHFHKVASLVPKQELVPASLAELYRLAAQAEINRGRNPNHHVAMTLLYANLTSLRPYASQRFFNAGNALAARAKFQAQQGENPELTIWETLGVYHQGMEQYPSNYRFYNGAAFVCLDQAERCHIQGLQKQADYWMDMGLSYARQGKQRNPNYAGFLYHEARAALLADCEEEFFMRLEEALSKSPFSMGSLKFATWYPALKEHPQMMALRKKYPDHSLSGLNP